MAQPLGTFGSASRRPPVVPVAPASTPATDAPQQVPAEPSDAAPELELQVPHTDTTPPVADGESATTGGNNTGPAAAVEGDAADETASPSTTPADATGEAAITPPESAATGVEGQNAAADAVQPPEPEDKPEPDAKDEKDEKPGKGTARRGRANKGDRKPRSRSKSASADTERILVVVCGGQVQHTNPNLVVIDLDEARDPDTDPVALLDLMRQLRDVPYDELRSDTVTAIQSFIEEKILGD